MMTNVLDIEETLTEIQEFPTHEKSLQQLPRHGIVSKLTAALKSIRHSKHTDVHIRCRAKWEMPIDTLARKHPYMYADALLG